MNTLIDLLEPNKLNDIFYCAHKIWHDAVRGDDVFRVRDSFTPPTWFLFPLHVLFFFNFWIFGQAFLV